jgi:hypothetical protein
MSSGKKKSGADRADRAAPARAKRDPEAFDLNDLDDMDDDDFCRGYGVDTNVDTNKYNEEYFQANDEQPGRVEDDRAQECQPTTPKEWRLASAISERHYPCVA